MLRRDPEGFIICKRSLLFDKRRTAVILMLLFLLYDPCLAAVGDIITVAGGGAGDGAPATTARLNGPAAVVADEEGVLYIADTGNHRIRLVDVEGEVETIAGSGVAGYGGDNGRAKTSTLHSPGGLYLTRENVLFIVDSGNHRIRTLEADTIRTVAGNGTGGYSGDGGMATDASLNEPLSAYVDHDGHLFITDTQNNRIRKVDAETGVITTVVGNGTGAYSGDGGPATESSLNEPSGISGDLLGNLYIADRQNHRVRIVGSNGIISTFAGDGVPSSTGDGGPAFTARLNNPESIYLAPCGDLYIVDRINHRIRKVDGSGTISTVIGELGRGLAGDGGTVAEAKLEFPTGVYVDDTGNSYIADQENNRIRKLDTTGIVSTVAGSGPTGSYEGGFYGDGTRATEAVIDAPQGIFLDAPGNLYIADTGNHRLRRVDATSAVIITLAGTGEAEYSGDGALGTDVSLNSLAGVYVDRGGNVYFADTDNHRIRRIEAESGIVTTVAGNGRSGLSGDGGLATAARVNAPAGVCLDGLGNIYIADTENHRIRKVTTRTGEITTVAGSGNIGVVSGGFSGDNGEATAARLNLPKSVFVDGGGQIYLSDTSNNRIRKVDESGRITTVAGSGTTGFEGDGGLAVDARLNKPASIFADDGNSLYISDTGNNRIRKVDESGIISTVAGDGTSGFSGERGPATGASLNAPEGVFGDRAGHLYISDSGNSRVRRVIFVVTPTLLSPGIYIPPSGDVPPEIISSWPVAGARGIDPLFIQGNGVDILFNKVVDTGSVRVEVQTGSGPLTWFSSWSQDNTRLTLSPGADDLLEYQAEYRITLSGVSDLSGNSSEDLEITFHTKSILDEVVEGNIVTVAGDGEGGFSGDGETGASVRLSSPSDVFVDGEGNLYIADTGNNRVRKIDHATGVITTVVGNGETDTLGDGMAATDASLNAPSAIVLDIDDNMFIADTENNRIRKVDGVTGEITTVVGDGTGAYSGDGGLATDASLDGPEDVFVDPFGNLYIADKRNGRVRKVDAETGVITTVAGNGTLGFSGDGGLATDAGLYDLRDIFVDRKGELYIVDGNRVRKVDGATGIISTVAGGADPSSPLGDGGPATLAKLSAETVFVDQRGNMFISDTDRVRKVDAKTGIITTVAGTGELRGFLGDGGPATDASISVEGIFMDRKGDFFLADKINNRVRKIEDLGEPALSEGEIAAIEGSDFDGDGEVSFGDFVRFATNFGKSENDPGFDARFDLDGNGAVSLSDFLRFVSVYGKSF